MRGNLEGHEDLVSRLVRSIYRGYIVTMEKKMEATIVFRV